MIKKIMQQISILLKDIMIEDLIEDLI